MLGSALVRSFKKTGRHDVLPLTRENFDLRSKRHLGECLANFKPDLVVHAAAKVGGIQANISYPVDFLADNLQMDANVIKTCLKHGVADLLYIGSSCMYPANYSQALKEDDLLRAPLEPTNEGYAIAKIAGSKLCEFASISHGVSFRTIIPSNLYGPGDSFNPSTSHLLASVIRKVHEAKTTNSEVVEVWGTGEVRREFTYVDDLAEWIASKSNGLSDLPPRLNVGFGLDYSVNEFYAKALEVMGVNAKLSHDTTKPEGMKVKLMDSSLARSKFGWDPKTDVAEGIEKTYEWFLHNQESGR